MTKHLIAWHSADRLITLRQIGFWSLDDFRAYESDLIATIDRAGAPFDLMIDMTEHVPQSADLIPLHDRLTKRVAAKGLRDAVVIGASPLLGMQVKRGTGSVTPHFVSSAAEGRQWLKDAPWR